jgi:DNA polymerase I-like protein with 3'-5' exonuclease and polymerase domains
VTIAIDTETELLTRTCKAPRLVCATFALDQEAFIVRWDEALEPLSEMLLLSGKDIVGHNIAYDFGVLVQQYPELMGPVWKAYADDRVEDTGVRQKLIDIARGEYGFWQAKEHKHSYSLAALSHRHLKREMDKDTWRLRYGELRDVPLADWPEGAREYALGDAKATLDIYELQQMSFAPLLADAKRQARAAWWLHLMSAWGITTDLAAVERLARETEKEYREVEALCVEHGLVRPKDGSRNTKAAQARMVTAALAQGKTEMKATKTGKISLDKEACADSGDPVLEAYAELSHLSTVLTKDVPELRQGQIHSRFEVLVETGRTSSSEPNIQNPRRKGGVRECFVPRKGFVFVDSDYDLIELRALAQVCLWSFGKSRLAERLNAGFDVHLDFGAQLLGISYEEALIRKNDDAVKDARQVAKVANFGYPGGMGVVKFSRWAKAQHGIVLDEMKAAQLKQRWLENWPEVGRYFKWIGESKWAFNLRLGEEVTKIEQFVSGRFRGGCRFTDAANGFFQSLAADIGKAAGFRISRACYDESRGSPLFGSRIVNFIHDQFLIESPEEIAHECAVETGKIMIDAARPFLPNVPATCTPCVARRWSKDAKAIYENGRLVPWEQSA